MQIYRKYIHMQLPPHHRIVSFGIWFMIMHLNVTAQHQSAPLCYNNARVVSVLSDNSQCGLPAKSQHPCLHGIWDRVVRRSVWKHCQVANKKHCLSAFNIEHDAILHQTQNYQMCIITNMLHKRTIKRESQRRLKIMGEQRYFLK